MLQRRRCVRAPSPPPVAAVAPAGEGGDMEAVCSSAYILGNAFLNQASK